MQKRRTVLFLHAWAQTDLPDLQLRRRPKPRRHNAAAAAGVSTALAELHHATSDDSRIAPTTATAAAAAAVRIGRQRADVCPSPHAYPPPSPASPPLSSPDARQESSFR
jgi:hypothetical protein